MINLKGYKRSGSVVAAGVLAAMALAAVLVAVATAADHERHNLSVTDTFISASPGLAAGGDRVAVVWTEEYIENLGKGYGHVYLRSGSGDGRSWGSKVTVFSGGASAYAINASVAVAGTTAHVVYVVVVDGSFYYVYHEECDLSEGTCEDVPTVLSTSPSNEISWVDVAVDEDGDPHVVWEQRSATKKGEIRYRAFGGSSWGGIEGVHTGADDRTPAIACANGYVHVVWNYVGGYGRIQYRRRHAGGWGGVRNVYQALSDEQPYKPDVAAWGSRVFVVWDWCNDYLPVSPPCDRFSLSYQRSNDNGDTWLSSRDVGTDRTSFPEMYESTDNEDWAPSEYLANLRPSIGLGDEGWPAVVWHVGGSGEGDYYRIYYAYALAGTTNSVNWVVSHTVLNQDTSSDAGAAAAGMEGQQLHTAYMQQEVGEEWNVYYEGFSFHPHAVINAPAMVAVTQPVTITLDGGNSYDPQGAPVLTYTWQLLEKPAGSAAGLSDSSAVSPTIIFDELGRYRVTLQVETELASSPVETKSILAVEQVCIVYLPLVMRQSP